MFFAKLKYYHMVKQTFVDFQKNKCYSLWSKLPLKNLNFCSKSWYAKIKFLKTIHRKELSRKENYDIELWLHI